MRLKIGHVCTLRCNENGLSVFLLHFFFNKVIFVKGIPNKCLKLLECSSFKKTIFIYTKLY